MDMVAATTAPPSDEEVEVRRVSVLLTEVELYLLSEFFNGEGVMDSDLHDRIGRKVFIAAAKAGLYDDAL